MTVLTNSTEAAVSHVGSSDYYVWDEPERPVSVHLNYQTFELIQIEVLRGLDSNGDDGVEIGGILLGRREQAAGRVNTFIEEFLPVQCGYSGGSVYSLSDGDGIKFEAALKQCKSEATKSSSVVGFFRSHLRNNVFLSPDDLSMIRRFFTDPDSVFLLIKTLPSRGCTAAFLRGEDGQIQPECAYNEVPLSPVQIAPARYPKKQPLELSRPVERVPNIRRRPWFAWGTFVVLAVVAIATVALISWMKWWGQSHVAHVGAASLGLHVERSSDHLAVMWNRNSAEIVAANRAVLAIRDGSYQKAFFLNQTQLRAGMVAYKPDNQNIDFDLELYRERTQIVSDTLHVLLEGPPGVASAGSPQVQ